MTTPDHPSPTATAPTWTVPPDHTPEGHRIRARTTWLLARYDYLQGDSAEQVCDRYGLKVSTQRDRARKEGWRKIDQPDPDPVEDEIDDSPVDCEAMADEALTRVRAALRRRRPAEAASWMRVHEKLSAVVTARADRERRSARIDQARGGGGALDAVTRSLTSIRNMARAQAEVNAAAACGALSPDQAETLSQGLWSARRASRSDDDPHSSHSDFSADGPSGLSDPDDLDDPDP